MAKTHINLQDSFLNQTRKDNIAVTIFLVNGVQIKGYVKGFDNFIIILEDKDKGDQKMVYKHAVSTILPAIPINSVFSDASF